MNGATKSLAPQNWCYQFVAPMKKIKLLKGKSIFDFDSTIYRVQTTL
jgi:hypothetical protein